MSIQRFPEVKTSGGSSSGLQGTWNASTNTPALSNTDTGKTGVMYQVSVGGTVDFGAGNITFEAKDIVVNNGTVWDKIDGTDAVLSVNGNTGVVVLDKADVGLPNVDNTSDANKPISSATQSALDGKVDIDGSKVLSANDFTDVLKAKLDGLGTTVFEIKTSNYTVTDSDKGKVLITDHGANPQEITISTTLDWQVGDTITVINGHSFRDAQITKSGWVYFNNVSSNITLKSYQGVEITNVGGDYYLVKYFNALTSDNKTALDNLKDYIRYIGFYSNEQTMSSSSLSNITGTSVNLQDEGDNLIRFEAKFRIEIVTAPTTVNLRLKPSNSYGNYQNVIGRIIEPDGTESKVIELDNIGNYPDSTLPESEISLDTSGDSAGDYYFIHYEWLQRQPANGYYCVQLQCVGGGSVKVKDAFNVATRVGEY